MELPRIDEIKENNLVKVESETTPTTEEGEVTAETTESETQPEVKSEEVPASFQKRIDELVYKYKSERESRQKLEQELKQSRQNPAQPTSEEEKREQTAREYLRGLLKEEIAATKSQEEEADKQLNDELDNISTLYPDFKREEVLKTMDKYSIDNVEKAYLAWKEMTRVVAETKEATKKDILAKPKSPSSVKTSDGLASKFSEEDIKNKSIWELAELAKKEAGFQLIQEANSMARPVSGFSDFVLSVTNQMYVKKVNESDCLL